MPTTDALHQIREEEADLSSGDLTLTAERGESIEILAREVGTGDALDRIEESVDETTMRSYRGGAGGSGIFPNEHTSLLNVDYLGRLRRLGFDLPTIKVPAGTTYRMSCLDTGGSVDVWYRDLNREEFRKTDPGGPESDKRVFISEGNADKTIAQDSTEVVEVDTSANSGGIAGFPYEEDVPDNREYDVCAIAVSADENPSGGGASNLTGFRLTSEQQDFFSKESAIVSDAIATYPDADPNTRYPFEFVDYADGTPRPLTFTPGDDLTIELEVEETTDSSDVTIDAKATIVATERRI